MADLAPRLRAPLRRLASHPGRSAGASGDLFEHFGVGHERGESTLAAIVAAAPCPECGWLRPLSQGEDESTTPEPNCCPLCAAVEPATPTGCE